MPKSARIELWSDVECNSGTRQSWIQQSTAGQVLALDNSSGLTLTIPNDSDRWDVVSDLAVLKVVRVTTHVGSGSEAVYEWRISSITEGDGPRHNHITVMGDPILYDLRNAIIRNDTVGGRPDYNLGGLRLSPQQYIDTYALPSLTAAGLTWISRGTVSPTNGYDIGMSRATVLELLQELAKKTGCELQLRRNGSTDYQIDLMTKIGTGSETPRVQFGRNLLEITRERNLDGYATRIYPMGKQVEGRSELSTIGYAAWDVTGVATGNVVTLADPGGGAGPVGFDDQLNGKYVCSPSGALTEIDDSSNAAQTITLATSSNLATGDVVTFFEDSSKTLLTVLSNPAGESGQPLKTVTRIFNEDYREERNWIPNPIMNDWATGNLPDGWSSVTGGSVHAPVVVRHRDKSLPAGTVTGVTTDGAHAATTVWNLAGMATGLVIQPGDRLFEGAYFYVFATAVASASGKAAVTVNAAYTASGGEAVTLNRPDLSGVAGSDNVVFTNVTNQPGTATAGVWIKTPPITVPYISNDSLLWASVGYTMYNHASCTIMSAPSQPNELGPAWMKLCHATSGATLASGAGPSGAYATGANHISIRSAYTATGDTPCYIKMRGVYTGNQAVGGDLYDPQTFFRWAQITIGPDSRVPVVDGSHGTKLWQYANSVLSNAQLPDFIRCKIRDLSDVDGYTLTEEDITLGGNLHVVSSKLGIDDDIRVVSIIMDLVDPTNTQVILDTQRKRVSSRLRGATKLSEQQPEPQAAEQSSKAEKPVAEQPDDPVVVRAVEPEPTATGGSGTLTVPRTRLIPTGPMGVPGIEL